MHATHRVDYTSPSATSIAHPGYCDRARCTHRGYTVHHSSAPEVFLPRQHDTTDASMVQIIIERLDEIEATTGRQVVHPDEVVISDDRGSRVRVGVEDLRELNRITFGLYEADSDAERQLAG